MKAVLTTLLCISLNFTLLSQLDYTIHSQSLNVELRSNFINWEHQNLYESDELVNDNYYRIIQFIETPNTETIAQLKQAGIELLQYIPNYAYYASINKETRWEEMDEFKIRLIHKLTYRDKIHKELFHSNYPDWMTSGKMLELSIAYFDNIPHEKVLENLKNFGATIISENGYNNVIELSILETQKKQLALLPYITFVDLTNQPPVKDDILGGTLHRANMLRSNLVDGRNYVGQNVNVLTRDDGVVGPHIDFQGRIDNSNAFGTSEFATHGDGVSGIFTGAGNLDPDNIGMASGAFLYVTDYQSNFLDETMSLHFNDDVIVTNSSYSDGCNAGYTNTTRTVDQQCYDNPTLLHVFSAGNSNNNDCGYGAGDQWGNITGGHKQGKNVIATANVTNDGVIVGSSSRGPAHDGRIKPDIAANGANHISTDPNNEYAPFGGTSGAAPGIAGITAMLHSAYSDLFGGAIADAALLKACLLNTANDYGNKGPDFTFGWGLVNAGKAVKTLEENRWIKSTVEINESSSFSIDVPEDVAEFKVMIYWADPESATGTTKALINDLDLQVVTSDQVYLPWVLDHSPNAASLSQPATTGIDRLNNMEQVSIENPTPGLYKAEINGFNIPNGVHEYYLVWEFLKKGVEITYPVGGEYITSGEAIRVHWDNHGTTEPYQLSYSTDDGVSWNNGGIAGSDDKFMAWFTPIINSPSIKLRLTSGDYEFISEHPFHVSRRVLNTRITSVCANYMNLEWDARDDVEVYQVYKLGNQYMEIIGETTDLLFEVPISNPFNQNWVAVAAKYNTGAISKRSVAISNPTQLVDCIIERDVRATSIVNPSIENAIICSGSFTSEVSFEFENIGLMELDTFNLAYQLNNDPPVTKQLVQNLASGESFNYTFEEPIEINNSSVAELKIWASVDGNTFLFNDSIVTQIPVYLDNGAPVTYYEGFDGNRFPDDFWTIANPDNNISWSTFLVTQKDGTVGNVMGIPNFLYDASGQADTINVIPLDLTAAPENTYLTFDYAYAPFSSENEKFIVEILDECGTGIPNKVLDGSGIDLGTSDVFFQSPTDASQWTTFTYNMEDYRGSDKILIRFININDFESNLFVDNVRVGPVDAAAPISSIQVSDESPCRFVDTIVIDQTSTGEFLEYQWDFGVSARPYTNSNEAGPHNISYGNPLGPRTLELIVSNPFGSDTSNFMLDIIHRPSSGDILSSIDDGSIVTFSTDSEFGDFYSWDFGDGNTSMDVNPTHNYTSTGDFEVSLTITNDCGERTLTTTITIGAVATQDLHDDVGLSMSPNPSDGIFLLELEGSKSLDYQIRIIDINGSLITRRNFEHVSSFNSSFDLRYLSDGIYFIEISDGHGFRTLKWVKQ